MADDKHPSVDQAVETIVGQMKALRSKSATVPELQGLLKARILNNRLVLPPNRTEVLQKVNHAMGVKWSMSKVKGADHTPYVQQQSKPIPVDELSGSSTVDMAALQNKGVTVSVVPDEKKTQEQGREPTNKTMGEDETAPEFPPEQSKKAPPVKEEVQQPTFLQNDKKDDTPAPGLEVTVSPDADKGDVVVNDSLVFKRQSLGELVYAKQRADLEANLDPGAIYWTGEVHTTYLSHFIRMADERLLEFQLNFGGEVIRVINHTHTSPEETDMTNSNNAQANTTTNTQEGNTAMNDFVNMMSARGAVTPELRAAAVQHYLDTVAPDSKPSFDAFISAQGEGKSSDEMIANYLSLPMHAPFLNGFAVWMTTKYTPVSATAAATEAKSRFSLTGERDEGIRSSWIGAGAAVIGGGLEMAARGGVSMGSAIGTVAGSVGAFFAGELVDSNIESQFGRYVLAGTIGLGLGAVGSSIGRSLLPGRELVTFNQDGNGNTTVEVPADRNLDLIAGL